MRKKKCRRCGEKKWLRDFRIDGRKKDGHYATCRSCIENRADVRRAARPLVKTKVCIGCGEKPADAFGVDKTTRDGLRSKCKVCRKQEGSDHFQRMPEEEREKRRQRTKQWIKDHPEAYRASYTKSQRKRRYGIDEDTYQQMAVVQNHACAICQRKEHVKTNGKTVDNLPVDHDHATEKVRGLLCHGCNKIIAFAGDDPKRLEVAAAYLRKYGKT
jgi:hypothetical protein